MSNRALSSAQIVRAALVVLLGFLASGVLGLIRTGAFSAAFGTSAELDAFYAAQRIPDLLFNLVAGGALGSSFIPVFSRFLTKDDMEGAWRLASAVMTLSAALAAVLALLTGVLAPWIVPNLLFPGRPLAQQDLATELTQLMLVTTVIFAVSGLVMGILNAHQRFLFPALALSTNNLGLIAGALLIAPNLPGDSGLLPEIADVIREPFSQQANIYGLALGAVLGALLHLLVQIPGLFAVRARLRPILNWRIHGVVEVLALMGPRVLGLAVVQINFAVNVIFASNMIEGSLVALNTAWFLAFFTLGVIAQSVGTAVFPTLSALVADDDMDGYRNRLASALRGVLFLALPATVGLIVLGEPVVFIFERGEWTADSTQATAWALSFFALGIAGHAALEVLSRAFYALADTWTPVRIGLAAMITNIVLSLIFIEFIGDPGSLVRGPFAGLALANSLTTLLEALALWWLLRRRVGGIRDEYVVNGVVRALVAALGMGAVVLGADYVLAESSGYIRLLVGLGAGVGSFFVLALLLRLDEVSLLTRRLLRR